ncbi:hypothetical protein GGR06_000737 [Bacteroides reticulotermitis]|uniref:Uncharacterized protein n=1 Tax=Bacteroides reticulotermitis TaxID=1133319 RepID=A0A840D3D6_9BACE|nr:hypothetical protein [Bacteroides reticulotermitis]
MSIIYLFIEKIEDKISYFDFNIYICRKHFILKCIVEKWLSTTGLPHIIS